MHTRTVLAAIVCCQANFDAAFAADGLATIKGRVFGPDGPLPGARVFLESGLEGPLTAVEADAAGHYVFEDIVPALVGVFAHAPGLAVDGRSVQLALDQTIGDLDIRLSRPGTISGNVMDETDRPVADARITRAVILGSSRVGIPFVKLEPYGITTPKTDARGQFTIDSLPHGAEIGLKIAHPSYAQGVVGDARVGGHTLSVRLSPGILLSGTVLALGRQVPVSHASIEFRSVDPPKDTVITHSRTDGSYVVRLRPGAWLYQATGNSFRSPNWQRVDLDPKYPVQSMPLHVAGTSTIRGFVKDAKSGEPIANARVLLTSLGVPAATTMTGPTGAYEFTTTEGETVVQLVLAPGHLLPPEPALRLAVTAGTPSDLPTFWVVPIPRYSLEVVDADEEAVPGAIVRVLEPEQFGWYESDENGLVSLSFATLPSDGTVIGAVEHPSRREGALFAITRERSADAIVQLQPLGSVSGRVTNEKNAGIEGAVVEASTILDGTNRRVTLWQTISGNDGKWTWPAVVPHVPFACSASMVDDSGALVAESAPNAILPNNANALDAGALVIPGATSSKTMSGKKYEWRKLRVLCGELTVDTTKHPTILVHAPAAQYAMFADSLETVRRALTPHGVTVAIVVEGSVTCNGSIPVLSGSAPAQAAVYMTNPQSQVMFEGYNLPPLAAILDAAGR